MEKEKLQKSGKWKNVLLGTIGVIGVLSPILCYILITLHTYTVMKNFYGQAETMVRALMNRIIGPEFPKE